MKPTAEQAFKAKYPKAWVFLGYDAYKVFLSLDEERHFARGFPEDEAWKNACDKAGIDYRGKGSK